MFKPTFLQRVIHKIDVLTMKFFALIKKKKIKNTDFTIISNNCWAGVCYEHFGLKKLSPTIGCFIMTDDYLNFIENLDYYINQKIEFIKLNESKHYEEWKNDSNMKTVPIGRLDDVEIVFLHYKNSDIAKSKWERRIKRINKNNLIFKFSYMNNCSTDDIQRFCQMDLPGKKICFVNSYSIAKESDCLVYYKGFENADQIYNDTYYWDKYFDIIEFINEGKIVSK